MNEQHHWLGATSASTVTVVRQCRAGQGCKWQCPFCPERSGTADRWFQHAEQLHEAEIATRLFYFQADLDSALTESSYVSAIQLNPGANPAVYAYWSVSVLNHHRKCNTLLAAVLLMHCCLPVAILTAVV